MAPIKFLVALCSLAIFSATLNATPASALSVEGQHINRHVAHDSVAKRKRDQSSRCRPRGNSSTPPAPSSSSASKPAEISTPKPSSSSSPSPSPSPSTSTNTPASSGGNSGGSKLGIAWPNGDDSRLSLLKPANGQQRFLYTWAPAAPASAKSLGFTTVPMLWGDRQIDAFTQTVVKGFATHVMGMNEPNQSGQSDMSPEHGAYLWKTYIQPLRYQGYTLVSPATTSAPDGLTWIQNMLSACNGDCTFDIIALHWYDTTFEKFQTYVELWHNTFNKPIWVTEFACQNFNGGAQPSSGEIWSFYEQATAWMDSTDYVESYMPFGFMDDMDNVNPADSLFSSTGLSSLGWMMANIGK